MKDRATCFIASPFWHATRNGGKALISSPKQTKEAKPCVQRRSTMASVASQQRVAVVEIGTGADLHGQDATVAAVRACRNAIEFNSLPGLDRLVPGGDLSKMTVQVKLGVPKPFLKDVDEERIKSQFPYGRVTVEVVEGGLTCGSGIVLPDKGDAPGDDTAIVVVAAVTVLC